MAHANAPLTELGRLRLAQAHVSSGASIRSTAERFQVSTTTVIRWSKRYRAILALGRTPSAADMSDHSSRPHRSPNQTHRRLERKIVHLRRKRRIGPVQLASRVGVPASTVHRVLVREGVNRLDRMDRVTGEVIRYERERPGDLVHMDVKKFACIPAGGGWKIHGRGFDESRNHQRFNREAHQAHGSGRLGYAYVHSVIDDHSRLAFSEVHDDETKETVVAFWTRAVEFFAGHGIEIRQVLTDNGASYRSNAFADVTQAQGITRLRTRPYRPQTNGKVERFQRTMRDEWGYGKAYASESARRNALTAWLHIYNHHRPHTALGGRPPVTRVTNVSGQNI